MIEAQRRPLADPNAPILQYDEYGDPIAQPTSDGGTTPTGDPTSSPLPFSPAPDAPAPSAPSEPAPTSDIPVIPDGNGGSVPIPPIPEAPTDTYAPAMPQPVFPSPTPETFVPAAPGGFTPDPIYIGTDGTISHEPPPVVPTTPPAPVPPPTAPPPTAPPVAPSVAPPSSPPTEPPVIPPPQVEPDPPTRGETVGGGGTGSGLPEFTPEENLIDNVVLPTNTPRVDSLDRGVDYLLNERMNAAPIAPAPSKRLMNFQAMQDDYLNRVLNGPDRFQLGKQKYDNWDKETASDYDRDRMLATEDAGAHGRIRSGMLTNSYGDLYERRARDRDVSKNRFLTEALEGTIGDLRSNYNLLSSTEAEQEASERGDRSELRTERNDRYDLLNEFRNTSGEADLRMRADRGEARTERDYQMSTAERAIARRIAQHQMENADSQEAFDRAMELYKLGMTGDPTGAYNDAADNASGNAKEYENDMAELMRWFASRRQGAPAPAGG